MSSSPPGAPNPLRDDEHLRYLGVLGLLAECAVYVPEELRETIEDAFTDACHYDPALRWRRVLNRIEIEVRISTPE